MSIENFRDEEDLPPLLKISFKAPVEHSILLVCFLLVWIGPALKAAGLVDCSWLMAFAVLWGLWILAVLAIIVVGLYRLLPKPSSKATSEQYG